MLDDDAVLHHRDLGVAGTFMRRLGADLVAHHHDAFDRLAAGQELRFGQDRRAAATGVAAVAATLTLGLQPGRAADPLDGIRVTLGLLAARGAFVHDGVRRVVTGVRVGVVTGTGLAAPAPAAQVTPSPAAESSSPLSSSPSASSASAVSSAGESSPSSPSGPPCSPRPRRGRGDRGGACGWPGVRTAHRRRPGHRCRRPRRLRRPRRPVRRPPPRPPGGDEQRHVSGLLGGAVSSISRDSGSAWASPASAASLAGRVIAAGQHIADADPRRSDRRWTARSGCARRIRSARQDAATGGAEHPRQRVHPQPVGKVLRCSRGRVPFGLVRGFGQILVEVIVGHVVS